MGNRPVVSKEQILDAAYDIATTQGLGALSIRAVAAACGVAVGTVYNSYPTKSELVNDVVGRFWQRALSGCMGSASEDAKAGGAGDAAGPGTCGVMVPKHDDFVAFCRRLSSEMSRALEEFRADFLDGLTALGSYDLAVARRREAASFAHVRRGLQMALECDPAICRERLVGALAPDRVCDLVWETMVDAARHKKPLDETLFALLRDALYA